MASHMSSRDDTGNREIQEMLPFDHTAAGHEGITTDETTQLIIKPCTQTEIDFYTAIQEVPQLQAWTPMFWGVLRQDNQLKLADLLRDGHLAIGSSGTAAHIQLDTQHLSAAKVVSAGLTPIIPERNAPASPVTTTTTSISSKRNSWKPSGGKKLETGLSIALENLTHYFTRPNVLDIKLGRRLWADDAPPAKRKKLDDVSSKTTSGSLGFRVAGMRVWQDGRPQATSAADVDTSQRGSESQNGVDVHTDIHHGLPGEPNVELREGYKCYDKNYGREFTASNIEDALITFLGGQEWRNNKPVLKRKNATEMAKRFLDDVRKIEDNLSGHCETRMYSASVLMVYEGDMEELDKVLEEQTMKGVSEQLQESQESTLELVQRDPHVYRAGQTLPSSVLTSPASDDTIDAPDDSDEEEDEDYEREPQAHIVRLIDFAHAQITPGQGPDENVLLGIRNLISILEQLSNG